MYYDSVFDKAVDDALEYRERERSTKIGLYIQIHFKEKIVSINGVECYFKDFLSFSSKLFESYYTSLSEEKNLAGDAVVYSTKRPDGRIFSNILEFQTYDNKTIRLSGEYSNEIGDTIAFDKIYPNGDIIVEEFLDKYRQILRRC